MPRPSTLVRLVERVLGFPGRRRPKQRQWDWQSPRPRRPTVRARPTGGPPARPYPGDFTGVIWPVYSPHLDGAPDPGEIVWTWVPFEEDHAQGKDRPVLLVGNEGTWLLGLMLTTRDHDTRPGRPGEQWVDIGSGPWDRERRPSEVRVDRVIRVDPSAVRREGAVLDRSTFDAVVRSLPGAHG